MFEQTRHGDILELKLARPPVNALNPALVRALRDAIVAAPGSGARAIVLSGNKGLFSAGLDVVELLTLDHAGMKAFWSDFVGLVAAIGRSPIPTVAAIGGHSPAGGAVLAIFCDYRVMARGAYRIGLNEVQVGLTVPEIIQAALRRLVKRGFEGLGTPGTVPKRETRLFRPLAILTQVGLQKGMLQCSGTATRALQDWAYHAVQMSSPAPLAGSTTSCVLPSCVPFCHLETTTSTPACNLAGCTTASSLRLNMPAAARLGSVEHGMRCDL